MRVSGDSRLDFAELDPQAVELDLLIGAAGVHDRAVGAAVAAVAGPVEAAAGAERIGDEALRR